MNRLSLIKIIRYSLAYIFIQLFISRLCLGVTLNFENLMNFKLNDSTFQENYSEILISKSSSSLNIDVGDLKSYLKNRQYQILYFRYFWNFLYLLISFTAGGFVYHKYHLIIKSTKSSRKLCNLNEFLFSLQERIDKLLKVDQYEDVVKLIESNLDLFSETFGINHIDTIECNYILGVCYGKLYSYNKSESILLQVANDIRKYGDSDRQAQVLEDLGILYFQTGKLDLSLEYFIAALDMYSRINDNDFVSNKSTRAIPATAIIASPINLNSSLASYREKSYGDTYRTSLINKAIELSNKGLIPGEKGKLSDESIRSLVQDFDGEDSTQQTKVFVKETFLNSLNSSINNEDVATHPTLLLLETFARLNRSIGLILYSQKKFQACSQYYKCSIEYYRQLDKVYYSDIIKSIEIDLRNANNEIKATKY